MEKLLFRQESFGGLVYDCRTCNYFFINTQQFNQLMGQSSPILTSQPDFSKGQFDEVATENLTFLNISTVAPSDSLVAPVRVYLEICTRCNNNCRYCLNDSGSCRQNALTTNEIYQVIDNLATDGALEVRVTGGEPTLHPDFYQICQRVKTSGLNLTLNSNLVVNNRMLDKIISLSPSLLITSLDASKRAHNLNRGLTFDQVVDNIEKLREAKVPLRLNCMLSRETLPDVGDFIERFAPLGCGFCFILLRPTGRAEENFNPPALDDLSKALEVIKSKEQKFPQNYFSTSFHVVMKKKVAIAGINLTGCNAIQKSFNINSDGSVLPCAFLYELDPERFVLGNVRDDNYSVGRIWRESEKLRQLRQASQKRNEECISCGHFENNCHGSCVLMQIYSELTGHCDPYCRKSCNRR